MKRNRILDIDSLWVLIFQFSNILKGPLILLPVGLYLSLEQQGYWFSFISIGAAIALADLGFTSLLTQFVAHEFSDTDIEDPNKINYSEDKFAFLGVSAVLYIFIIMVFFLITLLIGNLYFFAGTNLQPAWNVYAIGSAINLIFYFMASIINGLGFVKISFRLRAVSSLLIGCFTFSFLYLDFDIWALSLGVLLPAIVLLVVISIKYAKLWSYCIKSLNNGWEVGVEKVRPLLKVQVKYIFSWLFGYVIFQFPIPFTLKFIGANEAGQLGMLMAISMTIANFSGAFVTSKLPSISRSFGKSENKEGILIFKHGLKIRMLTHLMLLVVGGICYFVLSNNDEVMSRLLPFESLVLMSGIYICYSLFTSWANLTRANKEETFVYHAALNAMLILISYYIGVFMYKDINLAIELKFFCYVIFLLPWGFIIYSHKKNEYFK